MLTWQSMVPCGISVPILGNAATQQHTGSTSYTVSFTIQGHPNTKLVAFLDRVDGTATISNAKWGGAGGVDLVKRLDFTTTPLQMWELFDPTPGTADFYFETSDTFSYDSILLEIYNTKDEAVTAFSTGQGGSTADTDTRSQTVGARSMAIDCCILATGTETPTPSATSMGQTVFNVDNGSNNVCVAKYVTGLTSETVTLGWDWSDSVFRHAMCHFVPA